VIRRKIHDLEAGASGCSGGKDVYVENQGQLCIFPASSPGTNPFIPDTTPFGVTATGSYHETGADAGSLDCRTLNPHCATTALGEGTFTFRYAGGSIDLVVPSTVPPPCIGKAFGN